MLAAGVKFTEISAGVGCNVDTLLVGIVLQCRYTPDTRQSQDSCHLPQFLLWPRLGILNSNFTTLFPPGSKYDHCKVLYGWIKSPLSFYYTR